ncbi:GntR family transcriptional regulator [Anaerovorax odorimutans]|uniref:GntR family transcriptional regulator n=1 Tax=Anaerovorax odorimutans TaxID=109327 RepID=A0ABT1RPD9_9FIRM|nr:GntR family transcriptional regulator [Anaerovorax odorimutans]MCQ4637035.1 GntR family transcriptional regulator [Anaerovorax odorimutans]
MQNTKPLQQTAYDYIQALILDDQFQYDQIYSETKLSKEIGISRTPVRDALLRLAQEKYIDIIPSKGFCLHQLTHKDIIETFQVRSAIEGYCTYQITQNYNSDHARLLFDKLNGYLQLQREIAENSKDINQFVDYDNQFHIETVAYAGNSAFNQLFGSFIYQIKRLAVLSLKHEGRMQATIKEHEAILSAMQSGDLANIYDITMLHMENPKVLNLEDIV